MNSGKRKESPAWESATPEKLCKGVVELRIFLLSFILCCNLGNSHSKIRMSEPGKI